MNVSVADRVKAVVTVVSTLILVYVAYVSRDHITLIGYRLHIEAYQAETLFVLIDLPALVGKALQLKYFAASTRKFGRKLTYFSGGGSLACNMIAGYLTGGVGAAGYGLFIVIMFLIMEVTITKIRPAASVTKAKNAQASEALTTTIRTTKRCAPGCTCGRHRARIAASN